MSPLETHKVYKLESRNATKTRGSGWFYCCKERINKTLGYASSTQVVSIQASKWASFVQKQGFLELGALSIHGSGLGYGSG